MREKIYRCAVLLICCFLFPSCAHFTSTGRQQLAYAKYVKKQSHNRVRQKTKFKKTKVPAPGPSAPRENSGNNDAPQSVTSGEPTGQ